MTTQQLESSKIAYMKKLLKKSEKERTLASANNAIGYGEKHERSLARSGEIVLLLNEALKLKRSILEWADTCGRFAEQDYEANRRIQKDLYEQGVKNNYCMYR